MKKLSLPEILSSTLLFGFGLFTFWRGLFWFIEQESIIGDSAFYEELDGWFQIWIWGVLFMGAGVSLIISSYLLPKRNELSYLLVMIGGVITSIMYFIITSASVYNAINWLSPLQFSTMSAMFLVVAFFGGYSFYDRRK